MNKYSLKDHLRLKLGGFESTLRDASFDSENREHLCQDTSVVDVYNFDAYVKKKYPHENPASPDAICIGQKNLYFVEFKNQKSSDVDKKNMRKKFEQGTKILQSLLSDFGAKDCKYSFCVVLKPHVKPKYFDYSHIQARPANFGLDELNQKCGGFYDEVKTEPLGFYVKNFGKQLQCDPSP